LCTPACPKEEIWTHTNVTFEGTKKERRRARCKQIRSKTTHCTAVGFWKANKKGWLQTKPHVPECPYYDNVVENAQVDAQAEAVVGPAPPLALDQMDVDIPAPESEPVSSVSRVDLHQLKQELKQELKEELKQELKEELKQELKDELYDVLQRDLCGHANDYVNHHIGLLEKGSIARLNTQVSELQLTISKLEEAACSFEKAERGCGVFGSTLC